MVDVAEVKFDCSNCPNTGTEDEMYIYGNQLLCRTCIKEHTPYPFCSKPDECIIAGRCLRNPNCCE